MSKLREDRFYEKCAVVGVSLKSSETEAAQLAYRMLFALQHRGVEGSGMVTTDGRSIEHLRKPGMVRDVFQSQDIGRLSGVIAVGHNRYSEDGDRTQHMQPVLNESIGFGLAHNGNIVKTEELVSYLEKRGYITSQYDDSELFGNAIASKLHGGRSFEEALSEISLLVSGAYACVATHGGELVGFRDPNGIRPLEIGEVKGGVVLASETCAFDTIGAKHLRSVNPGEMVIIKNGKIDRIFQFARPDERFDVFELVYFARHDSVMLGRRVDQVRRQFGIELAKLHPPKQELKANTVVMAVPDTSVPAAEAYALEVGAPYQTAIIKNRYVGRTFIESTQRLRQSSLRLKHTMIPELVKGKDIIMIDDSIVRGNTLPRLIKLAKTLEARSVTVLIASPPVRYPDFYGIDTPSQAELIAANLSTEEIRQFMKADYLGFLTVSALIRAVGSGKDRLNLASFNGDYPTTIDKRKLKIKTPDYRDYLD